MDHNHPYGKPISFFRFSESKEDVIDNQEIDEIFNHPEIQDRKVVILSLIGASRSGKSFFLDYCLKFLYAHYPSINNRNKSPQSSFRKNDNWMGRPDEPLNGFSWRSGSKRETIGIIIWSDVFLHTLDRTGEKIAIFVMDTQGLFDNESTPTDNSRIFALGTLISSIQVLNLKQHIQEDQLQYLQFATECAQFSLKAKMKVDGKPFQNMTFLVRDWNNCDEYDYGLEGGKGYLEEVLKIEPSAAPELQSVRESIKNCYDLIQCFLLPNPGKAVAGGKNYDGRLSEMDMDFEKELKKIIEHLLNPDNLIIKKISSRDAKVNEMKQYIHDYMILFKSNEIPQVLSIYEYTVNSYMNNLIEKSVDDYKLTIYRNADLINENNANIIHNLCKERALKLYESEIKMGKAEQHEQFKVKLIDEIDKNFEFFKQQNYQGLKEMEKEREELQAVLEKEKQQRTEAEEEMRKLQARLQTLCIEKHEQQSDWKILEKKIKNERKKFEEIEKIFETRPRFQFIALALPIFALSLAMPVTIPEIMVATGITMFTASLYEAIINRFFNKNRENQCSIM